MLQHIKKDQRTSLIPVVMLSSSINENDMRESYAKGATQYWRKPVDFNEFLEVIQQLKPSWLGPEHSQPDAAD